jgi:pyruvate kinase
MLSDQSDYVAASSLDRVKDVRVLRTVLGGRTTYET